MEKFKELKCYDCQVQSKETFNNFDRVIEEVRPELVFAISDVWLLESVILSTLLPAPLPR